MSIRMHNAFFNQKMHYMSTHGVVTKLRNIHTLQYWLTNAIKNSFLYVLRQDILLSEKDRAEQCRCIYIYTHVHLY